MNTLKVFSGNASPGFAKAGAHYLDISAGKAHLERFPDCEIDLKVEEDVRGCDCFVVQPTCPPVNENLMELLIMIDAVRRASASRITAVIPYFGYARQDRKPGPRTPISAKLVANMITRAGADRVLTIDLHALQIQGFFDMPVDNLFAAPEMVKDMKKHSNIDKLIVVSPDVGGVARARALAKRIGAPLAIVDKRRDKPGSSEVMNIIGDVQGGSCVLVDDIIDSGGTLINAAEALLEVGAEEVKAYITHGVLSGAAVSRISTSKIKELVITDTILPLDNVLAADNIRVMSISELLGKAIKRTSREQSVSSLFY